MNIATYCLVHDTANIIGRYEPIACFTTSDVTIGLYIVTLILSLIALYGAWVTLRSIYALILRKREE